MFVIQQLLLILCAVSSEAQLPPNIPTRSATARTIKTPVLNSNANIVTGKVRIH